MFPTPSKKSIPSSNRRHTLEKQNCTCVICGTVFIGAHNAKYCGKHTISEKITYCKNLHGDKRDPDAAEQQYIDIQGCEEQKREIRCKLCGKIFTINVFSERKWYPVYCEKHRNAYKRKRFLEKFCKNFL